MKKQLVRLGIVFAMLFITACAQQQSHSESTKPYELDPAHFAQTASSSIIIDIRSSDAYELRHIEHALPLSLENISSIELEKQNISTSRHILVYDQSGQKGDSARELLHNLGYQQVSVLAGGLVHWIEEGYPVIAGSRLVEESKPVNGTGPISVQGTIDYDFGRIPQYAGNVTTSFILKNRGTTTLEVGPLSTSCACTSATINTSAILPGKQATITVTFNPNLHQEPPGRFSRTIFVPTNDPNSQELEYRIYLDILEGATSIVNSSPANTPGDSMMDMPDMPGMVHDHSLPQTSQTAAVSEHSHSMQTQNMSLLTSSITALIIFFLILGFILFFSSLQGKDLLEYSLFKRIMKSSWYPRILQIPTLFFFGFIIYFFFFGSTIYSKNPGSILAWTLWWPLVPLTFILFGRVWCAICPLPLVGEFFQKFFHSTCKPGLFITKYGIWITDGIFIAITLFDRLYGMVDKPLFSGLVFLLILFGIIILSIRYERRTFCKHICFLGGVSGNYSMLSGLSIESKNLERCATCRVKSCFFGSGSFAGCPYFSTIPAKIGMRNCTLCAQCIKNCPYDNVSIRIRTIASELWTHTKVSFSESFFAKLMVGVVIIQNLGMLAVWSNLKESVMQFGIGERVAILIIYLAAIALPLLLMTLSSFISSRLQTSSSTTATNFAAFGYAFIPIDVAGHLAHNMFHLLAEGMSILGAFLGLFNGIVSFEGPLANSSIIRGAQFAFIIAGGLGTLFVAYKIARARELTVGAAIKIFLPHAVLLLLIFAINIYLFTTPMVHRGG